MTECINVYRAPQPTGHRAVFAVVRCPSVRLFVTLMYRNGQINLILSTFFHCLWWPNHSSFPKGDATRWLGGLLVERRQALK